MHQTTRPHPLAIAAVGAGLLTLSGVAHAEPPSAASLQAQLRAAFSGVVGPDAPAKEPAAGGLTVTRQDDRYTILFPITGMQPSPPDQPAGLRTVVHPIDGGRWAIDSLSLPGDSKITLQAPPGGLKNAGTGVMQVHIDQQTAAGVFDPTYASPSHLDASAKGVRTETSNAETKQHAQYDSYHLHLGLAPHPGAAGTPPGLDADQVAELTGLHLAAEGKARFGLAATRAQLNGTAVNLSPDRVGALYGATIRMMAGVLAGPAVAPAPGTAPQLPVDPTTLRDFVRALPGLADKLDVVEAADGVAVQASDGHTYTFDHAALGFGGTATDGVLASYLDISLDNLQAPDSPQEVRALLPRRVHLHPTLGGIGTAELLATADAATAMNGKDDSGALIASVLGLFAHGGIRLGITDLAVQLGDSAITGSGELDMPAPLPAVFHGHGTVMAKNLDALIAHVQADPKTAQAAAVLQAAKRLGKPDGDALVWNLAFQNGRLLINGSPLNGPPPAHPSSPKAQ